MISFSRFACEPFRRDNDALSLRFFVSSWCIVLFRAEQQSSNPSASQRRLLIAIAFVTIVLTWLFPAIYHLTDRAFLSHVAGEWIGLAWYAKQGTLYPPLYADSYFGGTRYGPIPILLHAGIYSAIDHPIIAGKIAAGMGTALMICAAVLLLRSGVPLAAAMLGATLPMLTRVGQLAGFSINADALAVGVQLLAMVFVVRAVRDDGDDARGSAKVNAFIALAGVMCAVSFFVKISAIWATLAIGVYLLFVSRKRLVTFIATGAIAGVVMLVGFNFASDGRLLQNWTNLATAGEPASGLLHPLTLLRGLWQVIMNIDESARLAWPIVALAMIAIVQKCVQKRRPTLSQVSLLVCIGTTAVMFSNRGIAANHLLDLIVLAGIVGAQFIVETVRGWRFERVAVLVLVMCIVTLAGWRSVDALRRDGNANGRSVDAWRAIIPAGAWVLSCDATIPILMGQKPVIVNSFMLPQITAMDDDAKRNLVSRVEAREFDFILSVAKLDSRWGGHARLTDVHWGPAVGEAIGRRYKPTRKLWGYVVYEPIEPN